MTVCTNSRYQKLSIHKALAETGNEDWGIPGRDSKVITMSCLNHQPMVQTSRLKSFEFIWLFLGRVTIWKKSARSEVNSDNKHSVHVAC